MILRPSILPSDHVFGNANACIELVEFGDFECPHCAFAYPIMKTLQKTFDKELKFVYRNFLPDNMHSMAALAAEAAGKQNKFWQMHDLLYEHHGNFDHLSIMRFAEMIGLSIPQFTADLSNPSIIKKLNDDIKSGQKSEIRGTPVFFINGQRFNYDWTGLDLPEYIEDLIPFVRA